jgi:tol-pal system protein YbgF
MQRLGWLCPMFALSTACASGPSQAPPAAHSGGDERLAELTRGQDDQARRIAELEARLQLLETDARRARGEHTRSGETIRIGESELTRGGAELESDSDGPVSDALLLAATERDERRPALRLHGGARPAGASAKSSAAELAPVPVTNETLSVVPLPAAQKQARGAPTSEPPAAVSDPATSDYRAALRLLRERRFDDAALALSKFVTDNPDHALLDKAVYWRAEARYAKRDYRQALSEFEAVIARFPRSEKAPDSLFKIGMCLRHLGSESEARGYFRRVQEQYPNSEAAGLASREGSS